MTYDQYELWKLELDNKHTMYDFLVYNPKYAITQDDAWTYEMYGLCTLHAELDLVNKDHNKNSLGYKNMNTEI